MKNITTYTQGLTDEQDAVTYAEKRLSQLDKFITEDPDTVFWNVRLERVESDTTAHLFGAEASIKTPGKDFGARAEAESMHGAIDELKDELSKKIRRYKDKRVTNFRKGARAIKKMLRRDKI